MDIKITVPEFIGSFESASRYILTTKNKKEPYYVSITGTNNIKFRFKTVNGKQIPMKKNKKDKDKKLPMSFCI